MDEQTLSTYAEKADSYAKLVTRGTPDQDLQSFIDAITPDGLVLDLGCGPGNSAAMMRDAGLRVEATDACAEMVALAHDLYRIEARHESFADLKAEQIYDGVWANFSLLHARKADLPSHIKQLHTALRPGGVFHIGMKMGTGEHRDKLGRFYSYYSETELTDMLMAGGFSPDYKRQGELTGLTGDLEPFIIIQSRKNDA